MDGKEKKRILIAIQYLEIGGAERALIGLLNALDYTKYEVDLFVYRHQGEFMKLIPAQVRLLPEIKAYSLLTAPIAQVLQRGCPGIALGRLWAKWKDRQFVRRTGAKQSIAVFQYVAQYTSRFLPSLRRFGSYDLAISFLIPHRLVRDKVAAREKWCWIHTDYSFVDLDVRSEEPVWAAFDRIVSISEDVTKGFLSKFPSLADKIIRIDNILSEEFVRTQARMPEAGAQEMRNDRRIRLCSVGRYSYPKAFDRAVRICRLLLDKGLDVVWYVVGYGSDEALIRKEMEQCRCEDRFILLGKKENPYPYMQACDLYVQPSRYEGKAVTVREAQILCKPVVITDYPTAHSQLTDGVDGVIVPNDEAGAADGIEALLNDRDRQQQLIAYLRSHRYGNEEEARKIEQYLNTNRL